jgi:hypothetical protein
LNFNSVRALYSGLFRKSLILVSSQIRGAVLVFPKMSNGIKYIEFLCKSGRSFIDIELILRLIKIVGIFIQNDCVVTVSVLNWYSGFVLNWFEILSNLIKQLLNWYSKAPVFYLNSFHWRRNHKWYSYWRLQHSNLSLQ